VVQSLFGAVFHRRLFSLRECTELLAHASAWSPAQVSDGHGGATTQLGKRAAWTLLPLSPETEWIYERLASFLTEHATYDFALREIESPIKLQRYVVDDYHAWHVDLAGPGCRERKLGISVQLSEPSDYEGGDLRIYDPPDHQPAPRELGCAIAFPSYVPHEISPVRRGVRHALTAWALGPPFR
jgi:PKHD-type hydroxylase